MWTVSMGFSCWVPSLFIQLSFFYPTEVSLLHTIVRRSWWWMIPTGSETLEENCVCFCSRHVSCFPQDNNMLKGSNELLVEYEDYHWKTGWKKGVVGQFLCHRSWWKIHSCALCLLSIFGAISVLGRENLSLLSCTWTWGRPCASCAGMLVPKWP